MKVVSQEYKEKLKEFGREIDSKITYTINNEIIELGGSELNSITYHYESDILKSVMKQLDIDSNVEIPEGTELNYQFGVKTGNSYEYIDYGNYIVYKVEKQEDTNSYKLTCYDKMLYAMKDYEALEVEYPITIRNYINALCTQIGLTFKNSSDEFANYDKLIHDELYLNTDGESIGYTYRDVLDELAQVTGSIICINESSDQLEIRYINNEETTNKNLLNVNKGFEKGYYTRYFIPSDTYACFYHKIPITNDTYTFSANQQVFSIRFSYFNDNDECLGSNSTVNNSSITTVNIPSNATYMRVSISYDDNTTMTQQIIDSLELMVEEGETRTTPYEPYIEPEFVVDTKMLKDINVNFGKKYGPINSIVISRGAESDNVYLQDEDSIEQNGLCEIKISENQILKGNDRSDYLPELLEKLDGLEYYLNDYSSTGITIFEPGDRYNVKIDGNEYSCIAFNDEVNITQGLEEIIHTDLPQESETDYTKADKTDRKINQTSLTVDKHTQEIAALASKVVDVSDIVEGIGSIQLNNAYKGILHNLEIREPIVNVYPNDSAKYGYPLMISDDLIVSDDIYISSGVPYQNDTVYPSTTLYPKDTYLQVDDTLYHLDIDYLNYISRTICDRYIYEDGTQRIERNVGIDSEGNMYPLDHPVIEYRQDLIINVDHNSEISLIGYNDAFLKSEYLLDNKYTHTFATQVYVDSSIKQATDEIELQVREKVNEDEIIAKINLAVEDEQGIIEIKGNQITIDSDNFHLDAEGNIQCQDAIMDDTIMNTAIINDATLYNTKIRQGDIYIESFSPHFDPETGKWLVPPGINIVNQDNPEQINTGMHHDGVYVKGLYDRDATYNASGLQAMRGGGLDWDSIEVRNYSESIDGAYIQITGNREYDGYFKGIWNREKLETWNDVRAYGFVNISEEEKKKNIEELKSGLDILKDIDIYSYNYKKETKKANKKHYGVVIGDDYNYSREITNDANDGVDLYSFISICCKSIKEQQEQIEELQKEIKSLKEEKDGKDKLSK